MATVPPGRVAPHRAPNLFPLAHRRAGSSRRGGTAELIGQFLGGGVAAVRIFFEALEADRFQIARTVGASSRGRRVGVANKPKRRGIVSARNGARPVSA